MEDTAKHMAGKCFLCNLAYHCMGLPAHMSNQSRCLHSTLGDRTFAYLTLAQGLKRSVSVFSSSVREYLDPLVKAQYVDDIGIPASTVDELVDNIESVFIKFRQAELNYFMAKFAFGFPEIEIPDRNITSKRIAPLEDRICKFPKNHQTAKIRQVIATIHRICPILSKIHTTTSQKSRIPIQIFTKRSQIRIYKVHEDAIFDITENPAKAMVSLLLRLPDKQLVIICDASEHAAGYILLIKHYSESDERPMRSYAPVVIGSQRFTECQFSLTMYAKEYLAMHFAFDEIAYIFWA